VYPGVESNIKLAKLHLLKGTWISKFNIETANDELVEAYNELESLLGTPDNYYAANCQLELG
jgi:hypothetical protein